MTPSAESERRTMRRWWASFAVWALLNCLLALVMLVVPHGYFWWVLLAMFLNLIWPSLFVFKANGKRRI